MYSTKRIVPVGPLPDSRTLDTPAEAARLLRQNAIRMSLEDLSTFISGLPPAISIQIQDAIADANKRVRSRLSAQLSRRRKEKKMDDLRAHNERLLREIEDLKRDTHIPVLEAELDKLKKDSSATIKSLKAQLNQATKLIDTLDPMVGQVTTSGLEESLTGDNMLTLSPPPWTSPYQLGDGMGLLQ